MSGVAILIEHRSSDATEGRVTITKRTDTMEHTCSSTYLGSPRCRWPPHPRPEDADVVRHHRCSAWGRPESRGWDWGPAAGAADWVPTDAFGSGSEKSDGDSGFPHCLRLCPFLPPPLPGPDDQGIHRMIHSLRQHRRPPGTGAVFPPPAAWASDCGDWGAHSAPGTGGSGCASRLDRPKWWRWWLRVHYYRHDDADDGVDGGEGTDGGHVDGGGGCDRERPCALTGGRDKAAAWVAKSSLPLWPG